MAEKILTISIAAYNVADFIVNTLDSLILPDEYMQLLDIIVVDDGSRDHTAQLVKPYMEKYPSSIQMISKKNGGYGSTINTSLQYARGKYYKLLDGDDWFNTSELCNYLDYLCNSNSDLVLSPFYCVTDKVIITDRHQKLSDMCLLEEAAIDSNIMMHELAIKTQLLQNKAISITEHCFYTDEEFTFACVAAANTVSKFEKPIYNYRLGLAGQSVSLSGLRKHYNDFMVVAKKIYTMYCNDCVLAKGTKARLLEGSVKSITHGVYRTYMLLESPLEKKEELKNFDQFIKNTYPKIYSITMGTKKIKLLRKMRFSFYKLYCKGMIYLFNKRNTEAQWNA